MRHNPSLLVVFQLIAVLAAPALGQIQGGSTGICINREGRAEPCRSWSPPAPSTNPQPTGPSPEELRREREEKDLNEAALDANDKGVEAYQAGNYKEAVKYLTEAVGYVPDNETYQHNLRRAQDALDAAERANVQARAAEVARQEEEKRRLEELAVAKKYSTPRRVPLPNITVPGVMNRIKIVLSDDAERLADLRNKGISSLPQLTRDKIRRALSRYFLEHIPSRYARIYWDINRGAVDDMDALFDAIRKDLAERGELGTNTERAIEAFETNLKSRILSAAKK